MHEHEVVVVELRVGRIDLHGCVVHTNTQLPGRRPQDVGQGGRGRIAHPGMLQLGDRDLAAFESVGSGGILGGNREQFVLPLELAIGRVGEDVGADGQRGVDLPLDGRGEAGARRAAEFPEA